MSAVLEAQAPLVDGLDEVGLKLLRWWFGRSLGRRYAIDERGVENVPATGPVILASNHTGWLDGPLLVARSPRPAHAMVKAESWEGPTGRLLRAAGQIMVDRDRRDVGAIRAALRALRAGQVVAMFPEGRRGAGDFATIRPGVAWLALASGAPVVPVAVLGTRGATAGADARPADGARIDVVFGLPLGVREVPWPRSGDVLESTTRQVHAHLKQHLARTLAETGRELPGPVLDGDHD